MPVYKKVKLASKCTKIFAQIEKNLRHLCLAYRQKESQDFSSNQTTHANRIMAHLIITLPALRRLLDALDTLSSGSR